MPKFRKRPVVIEAVHWSGGLDNEIEVETFLGDDFESWIPSKSQLAIRTLEGEHIASLGDWVLRGVKREHYACKPDIFEATYEPVEE